LKTAGRNPIGVRIPGPPLLWDNELRDSARPGKWPVSASMCACGVPNDGGVAPRRRRPRRRPATVPGIAGGKAGSFIPHRIRAGNPRIRSLWSHREPTHSSERRMARSRPTNPSRSRRSAQGTTKCRNVSAGTAFRRAMARPGEQPWRDGRVSLQGCVQRRREQPGSKLGPAITPGRPEPRIQQDEASGPRARRLGDRPVPRPRNGVGPRAWTTTGTRTDR
jgi:hypothetical protein